MNEEIISEKIMKKQNEIMERVESSFEQLLNNLNQDGQLEMVEILEALNEITFDDIDLILNKLKKAGYIEDYYVCGNSFSIIPNQPYSDMRLLPVNGLGNSFEIEQEIVVSKEVVDFIKNSCRNERK